LKPLVDDPNAKVRLQLSHEGKRVTIPRTEMEELHASGKPLMFEPFVKRRPISWGCRKRMDTKSTVCGPTMVNASWRSWVGTMLIRVAALVTAWETLSVNLLAKVVTKKLSNLAPPLSDRDAGPQNAAQPLRFVRD
jgi:hypothetical protein